MKVIKFGYLSIMVFSLFNCSKNEDTKEPSIQPEVIEAEKPVSPPEIIEEEIYLTVNIDTNINTTDSEDWLIIHDDNNNLVDYKSYESGDEITFSAYPDSITSSLSITKFSQVIDYVNDLNDGTSPQTRSEVGKRYEITTTNGLNRGDVFNINSSVLNEPQNRTKIGEFNLTIEDIPQIKNLNISTKNGTIPYGYSISDNGNELIDYSQKLEKYQGEEEYLISILDGNNTHKYFTFSNLENQDLILNYAEFKLFDTYIDLEVPTDSNYLIDIGGFDNDENLNFFGGYKLLDISLYSDQINANVISFGYLNKFSNYRSRIILETSNYRYLKTQFGSKLDFLEFPDDPNFVIINDSSIQNFDFSTSSDYKSYKNTWRYVEGNYPYGNYVITSWSVEIPKNKIKTVGDIPVEILEKFPNINLDKIEPYTTHLNLSEINYNQTYPTFDGIIIYHN
ncbi:hypothetical protein [Maribacter sp. LLG6340-A2]|uniref:hypothetical protein n=1 Tax=Maribacter sp. LLG6340-A2 TaxID=3160834 RepID=UPI00386E6882